MKNMIKIDIDGIIKITDKAILIQIDDDEIWLPKSQVKFSEDPKNPNLTNVIKVAEWLAEYKGLI